MNFWKSITEAWCARNFGIHAVDVYAHSIMEKEIRNTRAMGVLVLIAAIVSFVSMTIFSR